MTRILICGDRHWKDYMTIDTFVKNLPAGTVIIQGMCRGVDRMAKRAGHKYGFTVKDYPADWNKHSKAAGPIRNQQMLDEGKPDIVMAFHNNISKSRGTRNLLNQASERGIPAQIFGETDL